MTTSTDLNAGGLPKPPAFAVGELSLSRIASIAAALAIGAGLVAITQIIGDADSNAIRLARSLTLGALFGIVLQRSRFCFLCHTRDFISNKDARGVAAILLAITVGTLGYLVVFSAWLPNPLAGRLPPDAHIGPSGPVLALAAFAFGIGMAVSGSCISGHLYRLGEGSPTAPFALLGTVLGFAVGFQTWNSLYVISISEAPVVWLPAHIGYVSWSGLQLAVLVVIAGTVALLSRRSRLAPESQDDSVLTYAARRIFVERWPPIAGGAAVGVLATVAYFQVQPLGVTAAIGSLARALSSQAQILPETLHGLDGYTGCRTTATSALSPNAAFVAGLVAASFASALLAEQFKPVLPSLDQIIRGLIGGLLLGWGAMTAIGCTIGTLLSGTMAGAASGWIFLVASFAGVWITLKAPRHIYANAAR